jgi:hypothetical protein
MATQAWWTNGAGAMPASPPNTKDSGQQRSRGGRPGGGSSSWAVPTKASMATPPPLFKRQRAKTHEGNTDEAAARPIGEDDIDGMSQQSYRSNRSYGNDAWRSWKDNKGRDTENRRKPTRRGGGGRFDKSAICEVPDNSTHHHWMQMVTQGVHQCLIQCRKTGGQAYDTWILNADHSLAKKMSHLVEVNTEKAATLRQTRNQARKDMTDVPAALPNPAADMMGRFIVEVQTNDLGQNAKVLLGEIWKYLETAPNLIEDVSYFSVTQVSEGKETRIAIGMRGWAMRAKLLEVMRQFGPDVRYSPGGAPPGYMERQLGEYCHELKAWNEY